MQRFLISTLFLVFMHSINYAQGTVNPNEYEEKKSVLLRNEVNYGFTIHTGGFGIDFRRGKNITGYRKRMIEAEFVSVKHSKEIRIVSGIGDNPKSYVYGKLNQIFILRLGIGEQRILYSKADRSGIEVRFNYTGGFSLAFAKPVYLEIANENTPDPYDYYVAKYDPSTHFTDEIIGGASFFEGMGHTKLYPGLYAKMGFSFDFGKNEERVRSLEAGIIADEYFAKIPMMAYNTNYPYFFNLYLNILFGRKW